MVRVATPANLLAAFGRVRANGGAPGIDGMTVDDLERWLPANLDALGLALRSGTYRPQPVRGVEIPKASGGKRLLGIPTVTDRLVQQALLQVLEPYLEPCFSPSSFGFRPGRSAHQAVRQAQRYIQEGFGYVVDLDLEKFFDRVNHDVLMARLARRIGDKGLLRLVRRFLEAGMMVGGLVSPRVLGTPQGGPLSPLLANVLLDDLDRELERRGHRFCRYADDCNVFVRTPAAAERVLASLPGFLEKRLKLTVNREKSAAAPASERQFLGYTVMEDGKLAASARSLARLRDRIREMTRRGRGLPLARVIADLNGYLRGWCGYFRLIEVRFPLADLDGWLRRRLRCYRLNQAKTTSGIARLLMRCGLTRKRARQTAVSRCGWWRLARVPNVHHAMNNRWFRQLGLIGLVPRMPALPD